MGCRRRYFALLLKQLAIYFVLLDFQSLEAYYEIIIFTLVPRIFDNYLRTPWSRVLLEKLTGSAASQEIPRIFGTRRFITVLTSARHLALS